MTSNSMTCNNVGRLALNPLKRAFWEGANDVGCDVSFSEGPHGLLSFTVPLKITWTGTEAQVSEMTRLAMKFMVDNYGGFE